MAKLSSLAPFLTASTSQFGLRPRPVQVCDVSFGLRYLAKPVLFGPRLENFADSVQVLVGRGGLQVKSSAALLQLLRDLLARPGELTKLGELAREAVSSVRGASARDARLIAELLP